MSFNQNTKFNRSNFFTKQESNNYFQHIRDLYIELISRFSDSPIYYCDKTRHARPFIKVFFKDDAIDKKYLQDAHTLSPKYLMEEEVISFKVELKATKKENKWHIVKNNKEEITENKRPLIALSDALKQTNPHITKIKLCDNLEMILKSTNKNKISSESMKSALKIIENY
jgi:hypothetical protein